MSMDFNVIFFTFFQPLLGMSFTRYAAFIRNDVTFLWTGSSRETRNLAFTEEVNEKWKGWLVFNLDVVLCLFFFFTAFAKIDELSRGDEVILWFICKQHYSDVGYLRCTLFN